MKAYGFTNKEIRELDERNEMLVRFPDISSYHYTIEEVLRLYDIQTNVNVRHHSNIYLWSNDDPWFIASKSNEPELLCKSAEEAISIYKDQGLHGMTLRSYVAFADAYRKRNGDYPDRNKQTFLLGETWRCGVPVAGFDRNILILDVWKDYFKAPDVGSRYVVLPPTSIFQKKKSSKRAYRLPDNP